MSENLCGEVFFLIKSQEWTLDLHLPRTFSCGYIRILSAFSVRSNVNSGYGKIASCKQQGRALLKRCYTINILKNVLLRQLVSEKNLY